MAVGIAIPVLYMAHCFLNDDHWSGELLTLIVGAFSFNEEPWFCWDGGGCSVCAWRLRAVLSAEANATGRDCDVQPQLGTGHSNWIGSLMIDS